MEVEVVDTGRRAPAWFAAVFVAVGLAIVAVAFRPTPSDPGAAPRWLVGCFGGLFASGGLLMLSLRNLAALQSLHVKLLAAILLSMFATIFGWIGFGPGPRAFATTTAILNAATSASTGDRSGRILFGTFGALVAVSAMVIWWSFVKSLISALRRATGDPRAPM